MPQFSDDLFLGTANSYVGTANSSTESVIVGSVSSTTLTVTSMLSGDSLTLGQYISGSGVTANSYITAFVSGAGGTGTYTLNASSSATGSITMYASGNAGLGNPAPMATGIGPLGREYVWDVIPQTLQAANIAASQTPTTASSLTLTAGTSCKSVTRVDNTTVLQLDAPRALQVVTSTAVAATLSSVSATGIGGQISFTSQTGLVSGQRVTVSGSASGTGTITSYSNPTTYILTAVTSTTATLTTTAGVAVATTAGTLTMTFTLGVAPVTVTVSGYDYYGQAMSEAITSSAVLSTSVSGKKAFYQIVSVAVSGGTGTALTVGTTDILGLPLRVYDAGYLVRIGWNNTVANDTGGNSAFVAADMTVTATTTTGDVRGTYVPSTATNGIKRLVIVIALPAIAVGPNATRTGALGVTQA